MLVGVLSALLLAVVQVEGSTTCPRPEQVAERLDGLLPGPDGAAGNEQAAGPRARLSEEGGELVMTLESPAGQVLGTRRFPRSEACQDVASAVAVAVAVLISDVHPVYTSQRLAPDARAPVQLRVTAPSPRPAPRGAWGAGLALGLGGSVDAAAAAGELVVNAWWRPAPLQTALRLEMEGQSRRTVTLQEGRGDWRRFVLGLGFERALTAPPAGWLRGFATARLAVLDLQGAGFPVNHASRALDAGIGAGARAVTTRDGWASWVEVAVALWPIGHDAVAGPGTNDARKLPVFEAFLRVGAGWGAGR